MAIPLSADLVQTLGLAAAAWFAGRWLVGSSRWLRRSNIPAPAVGGLLFALLAWAASSRVAVSIDTTLRAPLQIAFFTTIGFRATASLLRAGGRPLMLFWLIATGTGIVQNLVGVALARLTGAPPLLGLVCGSVTLTGGPATGLAFTETFETLGLAGAGEFIIASATFGICMASLVGNPVATWLIRRRRLGAAAGPAAPVVERLESPLTAASLLQNLFVLVAVMALGVPMGGLISRAGFTMPAFILPMILAAACRWQEDRRPRFGLDASAMEAIGAVALALFFLIALMDLKLWRLASLAVPMTIILIAQTAVTIAYCVLTTFLVMGRDYEAAVMTSGHIGFGLGITPNALANMDALTARYGPAPLSYLIVPIVGAFFIDFSNPLVITISTWLLR